jgi:hypothetical protein
MKPIIAIGCDPGKRGALVSLLLDLDQPEGQRLVTPIYARPLWPAVEGMPEPAHPDIPPRWPWVAAWSLMSEPTAYQAAPLVATCEAPSCRGNQSPSRQMAQAVTAGACMDRVAALGRSWKLSAGDPSATVWFPAPAEWHRLAIPRSIRAKYAGEPKAAAEAWTLSQIGRDGLDAVLGRASVTSGRLRADERGGIVDAVALALAGVQCAP